MYLKAIGVVLTVYFVRREKQVYVHIDKGQELLWCQANCNTNGTACTLTVVYVRASYSYCRKQRCNELAILYLRVSFVIPKRNRKGKVSLCECPRLFLVTDSPVQMTKHRYT